MAAVFLPELGLFDLAGGISGNNIEDDLSGALVSGKIHAELSDLFLGAGHAFLDLDNGSGDLAKACVGTTDNGNILDLIICAQEVFDLNRIDIFAAGNDNVLCAVNEPDETVFVDPCHIAGQEPIAAHNIGGSFFILIVAGHNAGAFDRKFAYVAVWYFIESAVNDLGLPAVAGNTDSADLVDVFHTQMHAAGADGFGKAVVGVILLTGEYFLPSVDKAGRNGLSADMHEPPLGKFIIGKGNFAAVDRVKYILSPGNEQPDDGAFFRGDDLHDPLRADTAQQNGLAARKKAAEPVHFCAGMIKRGHAKEAVFPALLMMSLLAGCGMH